MESIIKFFEPVFSHETVIVIVASLPVSELRGAIPLAIGKFGFPVEKAFFLSVIGNIMPVIPILLFLETLSDKLRRKYKLAERFFKWLFTRTEKKSKIVNIYGFWGLVFFVAIPLPMTGAWTGCVAAFLLGMKRRWAFAAVSIGVVISGIIVSIITKGVIKLI